MPSVRGDSSVAFSLQMTSDAEEGGVQVAMETELPGAAQVEQSSVVGTWQAMSVMSWASLIAFNRRGGIQKIVVSIAFTAKYSTCVHWYRHGKLRLSAGNRAETDNWYLY